MMLTRENLPEDPKENLEVSGTFQVGRIMTANPAGCRVLPWQRIPPALL